MTQSYCAFPFGHHSQLWPSGKTQTGNLGKLAQIMRFLQLYVRLSVGQYNIGLPRIIQGNTEQSDGIRLLNYTSKVN